MHHHCTVCVAKKILAGKRAAEKRRAISSTEPEHTPMILSYEEIRAQKASGKTYPAIARALGISTAMVQYVMNKQRDVEMREKPGRRVQKRPRKAPAGPSARAPSNGNVRHRPVPGTVTIPMEVFPEIQTLLAKMTENRIERISVSLSENRITIEPASNDE